MNKETMEMRKLGIVFIVLGIIMLLVGLIALAIVTSNTQTLRYEDGCKDIGMNLLEWEYNKRNTPIITCYVEGTDEIKRFKFEVKK